MLVFAGACAADEPGVDLTSCEAPELYRIDRVELPRNHDEARRLGLDLDRDDNAVVDNQLGLVISTLDTQFGPFDLGAVASGRLAAEVPWSLALRTCGDRVVVSLGRAEALDEVQLVGDAGPGALAARGTGGELPLSLMFDPDAAVADPGWLSGVAMAIELERSADGARLSARLGVALDDTAVFDTVVPPVARFLDAHRVEQASAVEHLDRDDDGRVTEQEVRASTVLRSLLAPDLRLDAAPALSFGVGLSGVRL